MSNVVCLMNIEADRATFTWSEGPASFEPYTLDGMVYKDFQEIAAEAREKLADLVKDYLFDEQRMPQSAFALAEAGHELYQAMFDPGADQSRQAKQVRRWLEQLAQQHEVDTLEIVVESPWSLPWNIIYDQQPDKETFLAGDESPDRWKPFWGLRYNLAGGRKVDPLRRMPLLNDPKVLLVVDPEIRDGLPDEQQKRLAEFVETHEVKLVHSKDDLQEAITAERPDLLYWLSHASADALVLAGEEISPRNMRKLLRQDDDENFGGLAFLNACQTAEGGESGSFFEAFHNVGFAGMIGTEHQTVDQFANPLGLDFLEAFLDRGEPVGSALRKLRGRVPLGLLYGTYCPPGIRVDGGDMDDSVEIQPVHVQGVALGAGLAEDETATRTLPPLPDEPYRSLAYYDRGDRALFAGRDDDIERFAMYLDDASTRILVLHGESGVGKSSFLHAGVIPYLEEECLGYRFIRSQDETAEATRSFKTGSRQSVAGVERSEPPENSALGAHFVRPQPPDRSQDETAVSSQGSVIFIRATNDLFGQLARALCEFCGRPYEYQTPLGDQVSADLPGVLAELIGDEVNQDIVRALLHSDPSLLGRIMSAISNCLPFTAILVIDQGEEVFTLAQTPEDQQRGRQALDMLRRMVGAAGDFKVIFSLRTEYYGRVIDRLRRGLQDTGSIREYLLTDFDEDALLEAIRRPTADEAIPYTSEVPFDKYGFRYAEGVPEEIAHRVVRYTTQRRDSVLPLMQVICAQLSRLARNRAVRTVTLADLETLGGIEGGMRSHVESRLRELLKGRSPLDKKPVLKLFTHLYLKQPDGTLTTALLAEDEVEKRWTGRMPFDELLRSLQDMRSLKVNSLRIGMEEERRYVSLGHDALAKLAAAWDEELSRGARMRKMAAAIGVVSAVAIVMAVMALFAWGKSVAAVKAEKLAVKAKNEALNAQRKAETNRGLARELMSNLVPELTKETSFDESTKKELAETSREYFESFVKKHLPNVLQTRPVLADARYVIGQLNVETKNFEDAIEAYESARRWQCEELEFEPDDGDYADLSVTVDNNEQVRDLAYTLNALGEAYRLKDEQMKAKLWFSEAATIRKELADSSTFFQALEKWDAKAATIRQELSELPPDIRQTLEGLPLERVEDCLLYASAVMNIGIAESYLYKESVRKAAKDADQHFNAAENQLRTSRKICDVLRLKDKTEESLIGPYIARIDHNWALVLEKKDPNKAQEAEDRAIEMYEKLRSANPAASEGELSKQEFSNQEELANCYQLRDKLRTGEEALAAIVDYEKAAAIREELLDARPWSTSQRNQLEYLYQELYPAYDNKLKTLDAPSQAETNEKILGVLNSWIGIIQERLRNEAEYVKEETLYRCWYYSDKYVIKLKEIEGPDAERKQREADVEFWRELRDKHSETWQYRNQVSQYLAKLLLVNAEAYIGLEMHDDAREAKKEALQLLQERINDDSADVPYDVAYALLDEYQQVSKDYAKLLKEIEDPEAKQLEADVRFWRELRDKHPETWDHRYQAQWYLAKFLHLKAEACIRSENYVDAENAKKEALEIWNNELLKKYEKESGWEPTVEGWKKSRDKTKALITQDPADKSD